MHAPRAPPPPTHTHSVNELRSPGVGVAMLQPPPGMHVAMLPAAYTPAAQGLAVSEALMMQQQMGALTMQPGGGAGGAMVSGAQLVLQQGMVGVQQPLALGAAMGHAPPGLQGPSLVQLPGSSAPVLLQPAGGGYYSVGMPPAMQGHMAGSSGQMHAVPQLAQAGGGAMWLAQSGGAGPGYGMMPAPLPASMLPQHDPGSMPAVSAAQVPMHMVAAFPGAQTAPFAAPGSMMPTLGAGGAPAAVCLPMPTSTSA